MIDIHLTYCLQSFDMNSWGSRGTPHPPTRNVCLGNCVGVQLRY